MPLKSCTSGSALLEEIDELPRRRSSYIATIPWLAMRCCGGGCTMNYNTISAQRIAGALGAEIAGVDLPRPLSDQVIGEIRQALLDHQVIFFHDQRLSPEQHLAFGRRFGELQIHDFVEPAKEDQRGGCHRAQPHSGFLDGRRPGPVPVAQAVATHTAGRPGRCRSVSIDPRR